MMTMSPLELGFSVFALVFFFAILGIILAPSLRRHHLNYSSKELFKAIRSILIVLAAFSLGLLMTQAKGDFEKKKNEIKYQSANIILMSRVLEDIGPKTEPSLAALREVVLNEIHQIDEASQSRHNPAQALTIARTEKLRLELLKLDARNPREEWLKNTALNLAQQIVYSRWKIYSELNSNLEWPLVYILIFWLSVLFFNLGLTTPRHFVAIGGVSVGAISVAAATYLVFQLDMPYQGLIRISPAPLQQAVHLIMVY